MNKLTRFTTLTCNQSRMIARSFGLGAPNTHFKVTAQPHPLLPKVNVEDPDVRLGDHFGQQQNHIWSQKELNEKMSTLYRHKPQSFADKVLNNTMYGMYHMFNWISGYKVDNPSVKSIQWRLILLESVAGVPGFVAAGFHHFKSLRSLERDHGWIATLLEEAENERMHLLVCMTMFKASSVTRTMVVLGQCVMVPLLMGVYMIKPQYMHRFVGYLEETACHTYVSIIQHVETPGTLLHEEWKDLPAPALARGYWHLASDAKWVDTLKCMMADEANHRDVNHTFAMMSNNDPNPFIEKHRENAALAWRLEETGIPAWETNSSVAVDVQPNTNTAANTETVANTKN